LPISDLRRPARAASRRAITLSQRGAEEPELRATVTAFVPRLAFPLLYDRLQHRLHVRISRRYFRRLIAEAAG
jgi:hypothetical protein